MRGLLLKVLHKLFPLPNNRLLIDANQVQPAHAVDQDGDGEEPRRQVAADSLLAHDRILVLCVPIGVFVVVAVHVVYAHLLDDQLDQLQGDARHHSHYDKDEAAYGVSVP